MNNLFKTFSEEPPLEGMKIYHTPPAEFGEAICIDHLELCRVHGIYHIKDDEVVAPEEADEIEYKVYSELSSGYQLHIKPSHLWCEAAVLLNSIHGRHKFITRQDNLDMVEFLKSDAFIAEDYTPTQQLFASMDLHVAGCSIRRGHPNAIGSLYKADEKTAALGIASFDYLGSKDVVLLYRNLDEAFEDCLEDLFTKSREHASHNRKESMP